jgi:hypothetical protein
MKKIASYIVVFALSTGAAVVLVLLLLLAKPELLPFAAPAPADSVRATERGRRAAEKQTKPALPAMAADSVRQVPDQSARRTGSPGVALVSERKGTAVPAESLRMPMDSVLSAATGADSAQKEQRKSMAKVLEAMDPASAARILNDFPDGDVKQIILTIRKRQAAKILAALDPDRAARIMR